jgi:hypothetical protein
MIEFGALVDNNPLFWVIIITGDQKKQRLGVEKVSLE